MGNRRRSAATSSHLVSMLTDALGNKRAALVDILPYSSDTDLTPFDTGAYASSTTFISGGAVMKAAEKVREQIFQRAALMLGGDDPAQRPSTEGMYLRNRMAWLPDGPCAGCVTATAWPRQPPGW